MLTIDTQKNMILSASGWRGVFAEDGDEESKTKKISDEHKIFAGTAAKVFAEYLGEKPTVLLGSDTRPTGIAIMEAMIPVLLDYGCDVQYAGIVAAPEIMAWARSKNFFHEPREQKRKTGFIYVSASHNPIGHNGLKFGLTDGGVLSTGESSALINNFNISIKNNDFISKIESVIIKNSSLASFANFASWRDNIMNSSQKNEAYKSYYDFCSKVVWGDYQGELLAAALKENLLKTPLGIVCDFNGSARTVSIDKEFLTALGFKFDCINAKPGEITHRIVPEGESLEPCERLLEKAHERDPSFMLGFVPDCDGDRGNLVIWDDTLNRARALEAQEVFALSCIAEFSHLVWTGEFSYDGDGKALAKAAIAINDPTSMRVDKIAEAFGVCVFRAEVGEANVVTLARNLREEGYLVRILGEGSAGGNITHPCAVRDPINTVLAIAKLLSVRASNGKPGLFEIWCKHSKQNDKYRENFSLADIIASLPPFVTTPAYSKDAILRIKTQDHAILKDRYKEVFLREWEERKEELKTRFGITAWEAIAYNGTAQKRNLDRFGEAGKGGLRILFFNREGEYACIWMRGSATEPVFRIMADVFGSDASVERWLLDWQRKMIMEADSK
ncbi:MAG: phosphatidylglycerol lysyltransferase [Treponema sp.]|nr:phosphatidylglycerol lysyltransferase [Treponema sp.]MCL2237538.1 phosphatidylglycerol lysyltransferase [Treponema sp.]